MIQLTVLMWFFMAFFGYIGWKREFRKELISLSGIILALFGLSEFDTLVRVTLFGDLTPGTVYYIQAVIFLVIVFFAYETRGLEDDSSSRRGRRGRRSAAEEREKLQSRALGAIVGIGNGYLVGGSLWYFLDIWVASPVRAIGSYPLGGRVIQPPAGSISAEWVANLPLYVLGAGQGSFLSLAVVILFVIILVMI